MKAKDAKKMGLTPEQAAHIAIALYIIITVTVQGSLLGELKALPSPLYGGDYYYQMGSVHHLVRGGSALEGANVASSGLPGYLPFYALLVVPLVKLGLSVLGAMKAWSIISLALGIALTFLFLRKLNKEQPFVNVLLTVLFTQLLFTFKYTRFAGVVLAPLWMLILVKAYQERKWWHWLILGALTGLSALAHSSFFFAALLMPLYLFAAPYLRNLKRPKTWTKEFNESWKHYAAFIIPSLVLSLLYWYKPLFIYTGVVNEQLKWSGFGMLFTPGGRWSFLGGFIKGFFNFNNVIGITTTLIVLAGIAFLVWRKKDEQLLFVQRFSAAYLIVMFSYFITIPLLEAHFAQPYVQSFFHKFFLLGLGVAFFTSLQKLMSEDNWKLVSVSLVVLAVVFAALHVHTFTSKQKNDQWYKVGTQSANPAYEAFGKYSYQAMGVHDVILSTKELSFALHAFSGVKTVTSRWAQQNNQYVSMTDIDLDAAIMLYGNDSTRTKELLEEHSVDYVFWHAYWVQSEYHLNEQGQMIAPFDPLRVMASSERRAALEQSGVRYQEVNDYLDPTEQNKYLPTFDVYMVMPEYRSLSQPWSATLDEYLEPVWRYPAEGAVEAVVYRVAK